MTAAATIIRSKHNKENKYFLMRKETAQNKKLSFEARGLLCYLLSMPDDWEIQVKDLKQQCGEARIYRILDELKQAKYLKNREKYQDEKGHWQWTPYVIYELPIADTVDEKIIPMPEQAATIPQKPQHGEPYSENREIIQNTESQNTETKTTSAPPAPASADATNGKTVQQKLTKPEQDAWYEAVKAVWGFVGGRNHDYQKFVRGEHTDAKKKAAFIESALAKPLTKPEQLIAWGKWQKAKAPDLNMIENLSKVQNSIDSWLELQSKPKQAAPIRFQQMKAPANLDMLDTSPERKASGS